MTVNYRVSVSRSLIFVKAELHSVVRGRKMRLRCAVAVMIFLSMNSLVYGNTDEPARSSQTPPAVSETQPRFPIQVPPASEVLPLLRKMSHARPSPEKKAEEETPQVRLLRELTKTGGFVGLSQPQCFRSIPTRDEFLHMVRKHPADANQILQRCNLDVSGISPLRQLPSGVRQLPEDTRQRPVGTWNNY